MTVGGKLGAYLATAVAGLLVLALAACAPAVVGSPEPQPGQSAGGATPSAEPRSGGCTVTANGTGSINMSGGGGSVVIRNRITTLSCGAGFVELTRISDGVVTFTGDAVPVDVAVGGTAMVGRYQVSVLGIEGDTARFQMVPA